MFLYAWWERKIFAFFFSRNMIVVGRNVDYVNTSIIQIFSSYHPCSAEVPKFACVMFSFSFLPCYVLTILHMYFSAISATHIQYTATVTYVNNVIDSLCVNDIGSLTCCSYFSFHLNEISVGFAFLLFFPCQERCPSRKFFVCHFYSWQMRSCFPRMCMAHTHVGTHTHTHFAGMWNYDAKRRSLKYHMYYKSCIVEHCQ